MSLLDIKAVCTPSLETLCQSLEEEAGTTFVVSLALVSHESGPVDLWHHGTDKLPCAGGMLHHVDENTEQALAASASYFT